MFESKEAFAQSFKTKNPDYQQVPDTVLADKLLAKFPQYESQINPSYLGRVQERTKDVGLKEFATSAKEGFVQGAEQARERIGTRKGLIQAMPTDTIGQKAQKGLESVKNVGQSFLDVLRPVLSGAEGIISPIANPFMEEAFKELDEDTQAKVMEAFKTAKTKFSELDPMRQEDIRSLGLAAEVFPVGKASEKLIKGTVNVAEEIPSTTRAIGQVIKDAEVIEGVKNIPSATITGGTDLLKAGSEKLKQAGETVLSPVTDSMSKSKGVQDYLLNLSPALRERLSKKPELLEEYKEVTLRNAEDPVEMSPLGYLSDKLNNTVFPKLEQSLRNTGSELGQFREKIATYKANPEQIQEVIGIFNDQMSKYGLTINNKNQLQVIKNRKTTLSQSEINKAQEILDDLYDLKGNPQSQLLIDVRNKIDRGLNFAKSSKEISNQLDSVGKAVRAGLRDINAGLVGREQAGLLDEYSEITKLLEDLNSATSKGKNTEFLIKRLYSQRDRVGKNIIDRIEKETGVNIFDEALVQRVAEETFGATQAKGLLQQEIGKSVGTLMQGLAPVKAGLLKKAVQIVFDPQKAYNELLKEAKKAKVDITPDESKLIQDGLFKLVEDFKASKGKNVQDVKLKSDFNKAGSAESATLYHGTTTGNFFEKFDPLKVKTGLGNNAFNEGDSFYFTKDPKTAKVVSYLANEKEALRRTDPKTLQTPELGYGEVLEFKLSPDAKIKVLDSKPSQAEIAELKKQGFDGIEVPDREVYESTLEGRGKLLDELGDTNTIAVWNTDKVVRKVANAESALIEEAKKYKTANEFVSSQYKIRNILIPDNEKLKYKMSELYDNEDLYAKYPILRSTNVRFTNRRNELLNGANGLAVGNDIVLADDLIKKTANVKALENLEKKLEPYLSKEAAGTLSEKEYKEAIQIDEDIYNLVNKPGATVELTDDALRVIAHELQHLKQSIGKKGVNRNFEKDILAKFAEERPELDMSDYYGDPAELEARMAEGKIKTKSQLKQIWEEANL